jgi:translin
MKNLKEIVDEIEKELDEKDTIREITLKSSRAVRRLSTSVILRTHRGENVVELIETAKEEAIKLKGLLQEHPELYHAGFVENALQELCEACIILSILEDRPLPTPRELGVTNSAYLLGLGDVVGELRRFALEALRNNDVKKACNYLDLMEDIYTTLMRFDYPAAIVPLRRKQDIARSLVEKTRGEMAVAVRENALEKKMEELEKKL